MENKLPRLADELTIEAIHYSGRGLHRRQSTVIVADEVRLSKSNLTGDQLYSLVHSALKVPQC